MHSHSQRQEGNHRWLPSSLTTVHANALGSCRCAWRRRQRSCGRSSCRICARARILARCLAAAWRDPDDSAQPSTQQMPNALRMEPAASRVLPERITRPHARTVGCARSWRHSHSDQRHAASGAFSQRRARRDMRGRMRTRVVAALTAWRRVAVPQAVPCAGCRQRSAPRTHPLPFRTCTGSPRALLARAVSYLDAHGGPGAGAGGVPSLF